jgi:hypothetical protein
MTVPHWNLSWEVGATTQLGTHFRIDSLAQESGNPDRIRPPAERAVLPLHSIHLP